jgi:hypothetical protein
MRLRLRSLGCVAVCVSLAACGSSSTSTPGQARGVISGAAGTYASLPLGATIAQLRARFGAPLPTNGNPYYTPAQAPPLLPADSYFDWVYPDVGVTFIAGRVATMTVYGLGASTGRGVGIGDPLSSVRQAYGGASCQGARGGPNPEAPGCQVAAGRNAWLWFSDDPIKLIALSSYRFQ